nr:hypothetical protein GCM10020092_001900 [Actinoplanes digitatis]
MSTASPSKANWAGQPPDDAVDPAVGGIRVGPAPSGPVQRSCNPVGQRYRGDETSAVGFQRLGGRLEDPIDHRLVAVAAVHRRTDDRRVEGESPVRRTMVRSVRGSTGEQPGRAGKTADDKCPQGPPGTGASCAVPAAPLRPLALGRHGRGDTGGRN